MNRDFTTKEASVGLQVMVSRIAAHTRPAANLKRSFIVNDVPSAILVCTDKHIPTAIFGSLLNTVIRHTDNCCIRISAKLQGNVVLANLKESYAASGHTFMGNIRQTQQLTEKIGGSVSICDQKAGETSIIIKFINHLPFTA
ncbi:MAG: HAMP domain-containing histidine kinase [Chitinophagaceae bacterium]|nr:HAMP domain-containing histidine kinase [Chitinophagaceae bacterium]